MSGYRRFVSYIYSYSLGGKDRNVGFAKSEVLGEQKRIMINLRGIYGAPAFQVYGFFREGNQIGTTALGTIKMNGGCGQTQYILQQEQIPDTGRSFDDLGGFFITASIQEDVCYASVWDDEAFSVEMMHKSFEQSVPDKQSDIDEEPGEEQQNLLNESTEEKPQDNRLKQDALHGNSEEQSQIKDKMQQEYEQKDQEKTEPKYEEQEHAKRENVEQENIEQEHAKRENEEQKNIEREQINPEQNISGRAEEDAMTFTAEEIPPENGEGHEGNGAEKKKFSREALWQRMESSYEKIAPIVFDSEEPRKSACLKIRPGAIGKFPRQNWIFANNSFLLYGYMKHHYVALIRMENEKSKEINYLLGVPGEEYEKEKEMAQIFGFEQFYPVKERKGYWCINLNWEE